METGGSPSGWGGEGESRSAWLGQLELGAPASPTSGHEEETAPRGVTQGWQRQKAAGPSGGWQRLWTKLTACSDHRSLQTSGILHEL